MLKSNANYRKFKIWQTYKNSIKEIVLSDNKYNAACYYAEKYCKLQNSDNLFISYVSDYDINTMVFHNAELGRIYVTEII